MQDFILKWSVYIVRYKMPILWNRSEMSHAIFPQKQRVSDNSLIF